MVCAMHFNYPSRLSPTLSLTLSIIGVTNGLCNAAVVGQADWNIYSQTTAGNAGCGLYLTGTTIIQTGNQSINCLICMHVPYVYRSAILQQ